MKVEIPELGSNMDSIAETCSALLKRIEDLEKLTEEQTNTIISFTEHTNALMARIERLEKANTIDQLIEEGDL